MTETDLAAPSADSSLPNSPQPNSPTGSPALREQFARVRVEVGKAVVGQDGAVTGLIIALLAGGHVLLEGVPGVANDQVLTDLSADPLKRFPASGTTASTDTGPE